MAWWRRSSLYPHTGEIIEAKASPAQAWLITAHMAAGREDLALLAAGLPPECFAQWDAALAAAFELGRIEAERAQGV